MTFVESVKTCFADYANFHGRASRSEYWWFALFCVLVSFATGVVDCWVLNQCGDWGGVLENLWTLAVLLPSLAVGARRLHDIGRSGWWLLLIITLIGVIPLIIMFCIRSTPQPNQFGAPLGADGKPTAAISDAD